MWYCGLVCESYKENSLFWLNLIHLNLFRLYKILAIPQYSFRKEEEMTHDNSENAQPGLAEVDLGELLANHRDRLRRMICLRLDRRLNGRVDASDVIQDAYIDATQRFAEYQANPEVSPFIWLRFLTTQKLAQLHRFHLGTQARDAGREVSIDAGGRLEASSAALAAKLVGPFSSPSNAANRAELRQQIQDALNSMEENDREILALRHFEQLDNNEAAQVLGVEPQAAYKRYVRAIRRLRDLLSPEKGLRS